MLKGDQLRHDDGGFLKVANTLAGRGFPQEAAGFLRSRVKSVSAEVDVVNFGLALHTLDDSGGAAECLRSVVTGPQYCIDERMRAAVILGKIGFEKEGADARNAIVRDLMAQGKAFAKEQLLKVADKAASYHETSIAVAAKLGELGYPDDAVKILRSILEQKWLSVAVHISAAVELADLGFEQEADAAILATVKEISEAKRQEVLSEVANSRRNGYRCWIQAAFELCKLGNQKAVDEILSTIKTQLVDLATSEAKETLAYTSRSERFSYEWRMQAIEALGKLDAALAQKHLTQVERDINALRNRHQEVARGLIEKSRGAHGGE